MPTLILALNYWLHLLATIVWLGGMAMLVAVTWPVMRRTLGAPTTAESSALLDALERRFRPLANASLIVLIVTGVLQMGGNPNYEGFFQFRSAWSMSLLIKHILILGMVAIAGVVQWGVYPALARARLLAQRQPAGDQALTGVVRRLQRLTLANLILGTLVLAATAFLTAL